MDVVAYQTLFIARKTTIVKLINFVYVMATENSNQAQPDFDESLGLAWAVFHL